MLRTNSRTIWWQISDRLRRPLVKTDGSKDRTSHDKLRLYKNNLIRWEGKNFMIFLHSIERDSSKKKSELDEIIVLKRDIEKKRKRLRILIRMFNKIQQIWFHDTTTLLFNKNQKLNTQNHCHRLHMGITSSYTYNHTQSHCNTIKGTATGLTDPFNLCSVSSYKQIGHIRDFCTVENC